VTVGKEVGKSTGKFARALGHINQHAGAYQPTLVARKKNKWEMEKNFPTDLAATADRVRSRSADQSGRPLASSKNYLT
jgi:hypothetical protein